MPKMTSVVVDVRFQSWRELRIVVNGRRSSMNVGVVDR